MIQIDNTTQGTNVTAGRIKKLPAKGINSIQNKGSHDEEVSIRGSTLMDLILLKMALAEAIACESIPLKVTMNEYIELSNYYSTPKSNIFIKWPA